MSVTSAGAMVLDGGLYVIGRAVAFIAPGGIQTTSRMVVQPRDGVLPGQLVANGA